MTDTEPADVTTKASPDDVEEAAGLFGASQIIVALATLLVLIYRPAGLFGTAEPDLVRWTAALRRHVRNKAEPTG